MNREFLVSVMSLHLLVVPFPAAGRLFDLTEPVAGNGTPSHQSDASDGAFSRGMRSVVYFNGVFIHKGVPEIWVDGQPLKLWSRLPEVHSVKWIPSRDALAVVLSAGTRHWLLPGQGLYQVAKGQLLVRESDP